VNHIKKLTIIVTALLAVAGFAVAESVWTDYDSCHPLLVRYMGAEETATIQVTTAAIVIITDTTTTTCNYNAITLAALKALIVAAEDDDGNKEWECIIWAGLAADSLATDDFGDVAANAVGKEWDTSITEDTSQTLFYNLVPQSHPAGAYAGRGGGNSGNYTITDLIGDPMGTGDAVVSIYVDGERAFLQNVTSPYFVYSAVSTTNVAVTMMDLSKVIDLGGGIKVGSTAVGLIRVARDAANSGGIGASVSRP